jgi:site-specific recombinase XerD
MTNLKNFNPKNERVKSKYFKYLLTAKQKNIKSVDSSRKALMKFGEFSHFADFTAFNPDVAIAFKEYLLMQVSKITGLTYSQNTINSILAGVREFFH